MLIIMVQNRPNIKNRLKTWAAKALLVVVLLCFPGQSNAQLMNIQLVIENEFAISGLRAPNWGLIPIGSGEKFLPADNEQAGRFTISATENTHVLLTLDAPEVLVSEHGSYIAFALEAAFVQDGLKDAGLAKPIVDNQAYFPLSTGKLLLNQNIFERIQELRTTVFLYGKVYVDDAPPSVYSGIVRVNVEFL